MVSNFSDRLSRAMKLKNVSSRALSERMGGSPSHTYINRLSKGDALPKGSDVIALSKALGVSIDYLMRETGIEVSTPKFRTKGMGKKLSESIRQEALRKVEAYMEISEVLIERIPFNLNLDKSMFPERLAKEVRSAWNLAQMPIPNVARLLEDHGIVVVGVNADTKFDGESFWVNDKIPVVVYNKNNTHIERRRLTLLHEFGHIVYSGNDLENEEKLCHSFASALLLPPEVLVEQVGGRKGKVSGVIIRQLQDTYGISMDAVFYAMKDKGLVSESWYRHLNIRKNTDKEFKQYVEKSRYNEPESSRFLTLVFRALSSDLITYSKAKSLIGDEFSTLPELL